MMAKYRNKPIVIEADQWFPGKRVTGVTEAVHDPGDGTTVSNGYGFVITIHGDSAKVVPGDWVITEPDGVHHYPCKPDIFAMRYETELPTIVELEALLNCEEKAEKNPPASKLTTSHREANESGIDPQTGQQNKYCVLSDEERAKGFVRPVHRSYRHLKCGTTTTMGLALCETYARDPGFYGGTFCCACGTHFPLIEADPSDPTNPEKNRRAFVWPDGTGVGE